MMDTMRRALEQGLPHLGLTLPEERKDLLCRFAADMLAQNQVMNLTAITAPDEVAKRHLLDSLSLLTAADMAGKRVIDIGCGAGFPGVPLKIACPDMELILLDSLGKRMDWLSRELDILEINAQCVTARAEEEAAKRTETCDIAVSRAVARLNILLELAAPYVKVGGQILAMKGASWEQELSEAKRAISVLGLQTETVRDFSREDGCNRVIVLKKVRPTPPRYPRRYAKIKQDPL